MTKYETVYILDPGYDETRAGEEADKVSGWIKDIGGEVVEVQKWGKRRLAYEVNKKRDGVYTIFVFQVPCPGVNEVERRLRLNEDVMRVLTTLYISPELTRGVPEGEGNDSGDDD